MEAMKETFIPALNAFTELLKESYKIHADHIVQLGEMQKHLLAENTRMKQHAELTLEQGRTDNLTKDLINYCTAFEKSAKAYRGIFQSHVDDTNFMLGSISSHWGGYIEKLGVQILLNLLRKDYGVHTFIEHFKRYWHKSKNVEIDLLALSDTHVYIVDVKNQLNENSFKQMLISMEKMKEQVPEYNHLILQPVFFCMHAEEKVLKVCTIGGLWVLRYKGFDREKPQNSFEWLMR